MNKALKQWQEKKEYLEEQLGIISDPSQKLTLRKQIEECDQEISRLSYQSSISNQSYSQPQNPMKVATTKLSGKELEQLQTALLEAFDLQSIKQMITFKLDKDLNSITTSSGLGNVIFDLITVANKEGWINQLISCAKEYRPQNQIFNSVADELLSKLLASNKPNEIQENPDSNNQNPSQEQTNTPQPISQITFNTPNIIDVGIDKLKQVISTVEILLLTVNEWERKALLSEMTPLNGEEAILQGALSSITYRIGKFGNYPAAYTESTMGSLGRQGATLTAERAINELKPKAVFLLGIAFGIDNSKQKLGDVLIAESIFPYESQKLNENFSVHRGQSVPCSNILSERFRMRRSDWKPTFNGQSFDVSVYQGLVLSGDKVVNNREFRDALVKEFPTAIGGEMEGAGAYAAVTPPTQVILIKSICDWADGDKDDEAQPFAAFTAVSLAKHVLSKPDVLHPLISSDYQTQTTTSNISYPLATKISPILNNTPGNIKYSAQLIQLLKQKFESVVNKQPRQLLVELKEFLNFIKNNNLLENIISKIYEDLDNRIKLTKNQFENEKKKSIEIKDALLAKYPQMDDSNIKVSYDLNDPSSYLFSFKKFNEITNEKLTIPPYDLDDKPTEDFTQNDELLRILELKINTYKQVDQEINYNYQDLKAEHKHKNQEWLNYCQVSASMALFRLDKIVSKINPLPTDESEFRKLSIQEKLEWVFQQMPEHWEYSWVNDLFKGKASENDKKIQSKIEHTKQNLKRVYEKIDEEMVLANQPQSRNPQKEVSVPAVEAMPQLSSAPFNQQKPNNRTLENHMSKYQLAQLSNLQFVQLIEKKLNRNEVKLVWLELFNSNIDDELPNRTFTDCIIELRIRAEKQNLLFKLYQTLIQLRADIENP